MRKKDISGNVNFTVRRYRCKVEPLSASECEELKNRITAAFAENY